MPCPCHSYLFQATVSCSAEATPVESIQSLRFSIALSILFSPQVVETVDVGSNSGAEQEVSLSRLGVRSSSSVSVSRWSQAISGGPFDQVAAMKNTYWVFYVLSSVKFVFFISCVLSLFVASRVSSMTSLRLSWLWATRALWSLNVIELCSKVKSWEVWMVRAWLKNWNHLTHLREPHFTSLYTLTFILWIQYAHASHTHTWHVVLLQGMDNCVFGSYVLRPARATCRVLTPSQLLKVEPSQLQKVVREPSGNSGCLSCSSSGPSGPALPQAWKRRFLLTFEVPASAYAFWTTPKPKAV